MKVVRRSLVAGCLAGCLALPAAAAGGRGMTWGKVGHDPSIGTDHVSCLGCDAYVGDTSCKEYLPMLCLNQDGSPDPGVVPSGFYAGWTKGHIGLTLNIQGVVLTSLNVADQICQHYFGPGYRMAEFHDGGGGWGWHAYANVSPNQRFWVHINDQPANCWDP
jgi:hypothetical protein